MKTMAAQVDESLFVERMVAALSVAFGALATLLAAIGLYGVMSYAVARRTREIGIRMALGAERGRVLWLVLREVAVMALAGHRRRARGRAVADAAGAVAAVRSVAERSGDAGRWRSVLLALVAIAAGYIPARRATTIDPMIALK